MISPTLRSSLLSSSLYTDVQVQEVIQELWSGYGKLFRVVLSSEAGRLTETRIVKNIQLAQAAHHPRGWNTSRSHQRKLRSYQVEGHWYEHFGKNCPPTCRIPQLYPHSHNGTREAHTMSLILEDLDASGFPDRATPESVQPTQIHAVLAWLAHFHAFHLGTEPTELWETGSYWHLDTRPDELERLKHEDPALAQAAAPVDQALKNATYQTLIHGDAKLANFCFSPSAQKVAAVDFQYVGGGCGMKDLAYFIGSCLDETECERQESALLQAYFTTFHEALSLYHPQISAEAVEQEWRALYPLAWTDFHRFLKGWSPGHWKINSYSERLAQEVIASL